MKFNILHGKESSLELTPFQEGNCYITHDGYFYVDLNIGTAVQPNYKRIKLNANQAESLLDYDVIPKEVHVGNDEVMPENATIQILLDGNNEQIALENKLTDYIDASMTLQLEEAKNKGIFDGEDGKSAYDYAQESGYIGSEEDFSRALSKVTVEGSIRADSWSIVQQLVRLGKASQLFQVGEQLICNHETYGELVWDIIGIDHDIPADKNRKHSLTLQLHGVLPKLAYSDIHAMFYANNILPAGTYNFTIPAGIDDAHGGGKTYYFILTQDVPVGGVIYFPWTTEQATEVKLYTYPNNIDPMIEHTTVQEGALGTALETLGELNSFKLRLGSNNWKNSAAKQFLNSDAGVGEVWQPTNKYGRPPVWNASTAGFLNGIDRDFLDVIGEVEKVTVISDFDKETAEADDKETNIEKFFLLSSTEVYGWDEANIDEGEVYTFYKENSSNSSQNGAADTNRIKYRIDTKLASEWWLRTPQKDAIELTRCVTADGRVGRSGVRYAYGICPACCVI